MQNRKSVPSGVQTGYVNIATGYVNIETENSDPNGINNPNISTRSNYSNAVESTDELVNNEIVRREGKRNSFINFSRRQLNNSEIDLLNLGPKFVLNRNEPLHSLIADIETFAAHLNSDDQEFFKSKAIKYFEKEQAIEPRTKVLWNLKRDPTIKFLPADKAQKLVIIDKDEYLKKLEKTIDDLNVVEVLEDPTQIIKHNVHNLAKAKHLPKELKEACVTPLYPCVPNLTCRIKIHKKDCPLRPIVTKYSAPTYKLEKALAKFLTPYVVSNKYSVTSSIQALEKIKYVRNAINPNVRMASLDIISLFPSINCNFAKQIILTKLKDTDKFTAKQISAIERAINLVINSNYFKVLGKIYNQQTGAPMGSPVSNLFAEVTVQKLEEIVFSQTHFKPILYMRYVDDCITLFDTENNDFNAFFNSMNSTFNNIKFTYEDETNRKLPFLDIELIRLDNSIEHRVYYKPTAEPIANNPMSSQPSNYKIAVFNSYIYRALRFSSNMKHRNAELQKIKELIITSGYPKKLFYKILHRAESKIFPKTTLQPLTNMREKIFVPVNFNPNLENLYRTFSSKATKNIIPAYKTYPSISQLLCTERVETIVNSGIYMIPLIHPSDPEILKFYFGQTKRELSIRIKDHSETIQGKRPPNSLSIAVNENNLIPIWKEASIICRPPRIAHFSIYETIQILTYDEFCVNSNLPFQFSSSIVKFIHENKELFRSSSTVMQYIYKKIFEEGERIPTRMPISWTKIISDHVLQQ